MKTIRFHKTTCGVELLLNVGTRADVREDFAPGEAYNTDFFEILFFKKATGSLLLNHNRIPIADNMLVFIAPFQKQKWQLDHDQDVQFLVFQEDFLNDFFADKLFTYRLLFFYPLHLPLFLKVPDAEMEMICRDLAAIKEELTHHQPDSEHMVRAMLYTLLTRLNRKYASAYQLPIEKSSDNYACRFKRLVEQHIRTRQRIEDYTQMLGLSRVSLNKATQAQFNMPASHLIKQRLLSEIKDMLLYSGLSTTELAAELNFPEPNHLMRFFKKHTGLTLTQFVAGYQNGSI